MKYRQWLVSSCAPASLQEWLAEELERRGIDGVYTRYILSLLLADTIDPAECAHVVAHSRANIQAHRVSENRLGDKSRHRRLKCWDRRKEQQGLLVPHCQQHVGQCCDCSLSYLDSEQRKKLAAVECLKSASEQKSGIEKLIDEVCAKLKNFQADIETNPKLHAEIKDFSKPSPPQEQAELYYSAFPALSGKLDAFSGTGDESLTSLQEQEAWKLKPTVWRKENHGCAEKQLPDIQTLAADDNEEKENVQNDLGKETTTETKPDFSCFSKIPLNEFGEEIEYVKSLELESQPLFIVPKMKTPATKVANITMYTPFTSSALYHSQGMGIRKVRREDDRYSGEGREKEGGVKNFEDEEEDTLQSEDKLCLTSKLLLANVSLEENDMVTDLASKFNSELASIWDTGECIPEISLNSHNLDFSFRILSVRSPVQDVPESSPTSVNYFIGSNLPSVWSAKKEDIKILNGQVISEFQELSMTIPLMPNLVHNKMELSGEDVLIWSSGEESDLCLDDGSSQSCKLDLSEQAWEALSTHTCDAESEDQSNVFTGSETALPAFEEYERPHSSSSNCVSPLDSTVEAVKGIYKLWESPPPQQSFPLAEAVQIPHSTAPYGEKVVNWISNQRKVESPDWHAVSTQNEKCTLTYHKGESRFKEVVPLTRAKAEISEQLLSENEISLSLEDFNKDMLCKPDEPEENLLTSPKTHFQPISQDSSETESLADPMDMIEPGLVPSPKHCVLQSPLVVNESITAKEEDNSDKTASNERVSWSASSSMDEMLFLTGEVEGGEGRVKNKVQKSSESVNMLQAFHSNLKPDLLLLEDKSTSTDSCSAIKSSRDGLASLGFAHFDQDQIWSVDTVEEQRSDRSLAWKWSTADDSDEVNWKSGITENPVDAGFDNDSTTLELDFTLKAMKKELEEEEEELFRDINLLSDSEDVEPTFQDDFAFPLNGGWALGDEDDEICDVDGQMEPQLSTDQWEQDLVFVEEPSFLDDSKVEASEPMELPSVPAEKALYSTELESEWYKSSQPFSVPLPKKSKVKKTHSQKQQPQHQQQHRKPCTFFLEGNCRRSDCKFSHNLGSITCRFWEEGSCFKGETCPFLHGYTSDPEFGEISSAKCKFALESEADFPSLSTLSSSEPSSKQFPKELVVGRIIRPKKKKMGLAASAVSGIKKANSPLPSK